jgi:arginine deiminase
MGSLINVTSEIGKLNKVVLHRPGKELENLVPEYLGRLLFDDIPYLKAAREEHDLFAQLLRDNDVEVLYLEELFTEVLCNYSIKLRFLKEFLHESKITSPALREILIEYLSSMRTKDMVDNLMAGVKKIEVKISEASSLVELINDEYPFFLDPMPNLYFTRDPGASIGQGLTINTMQTEARRRETLFLEYVYKYHPIFKEDEIPLWYDRVLPYSLEGGDELVLSEKIVAIGCSQRTSAEAIEIVAKSLLYNNTTFEKILVFEIPSCRAFMHLDTVFTMVDYDKFTIHPGVEGPMNVFEIIKGTKGRLQYKAHKDILRNILKDCLKLSSVDLIRCGGGDYITAGREQWNDGTNTLAIAPGIVVTYDRNYVTNEVLCNHGIKVLSVPSGELSRGRGGPRCMSMPLNRENI